MADLGDPRPRLPVKSANEWLHPLRRHLLRRSLAGRAPVNSVLFMCVGNLYRSPFAARAFTRALAAAGGREVRCESSGVVAVGRSVPQVAIAAAARLDLDLTGHASSVVTGTMVRRAELLLVMDPALYRLMRRRFGRARRDVLLLGDLDPSPAARRAIEDPYGLDEDRVFEVFQRIDRCAISLAEILGAQRVRSL